MDRFACGPDPRLLIGEQLDRCPPSNFFADTCGPGRTNFWVADVASQICRSQNERRGQYRKDQGGCCESGSWSRKPSKLPQREPCKRAGDDGQKQRQHGGVLVRFNQSLWNVRAISENLLGGIA